MQKLLNILDIDNTILKADLSKLKKTLLKEVGRECKDHAPLCFTCEIWRAYNRLVSVLDL